MISNGAYILRISQSFVNLVTQLHQVGAMLPGIPLTKPRTESGRLSNYSLKKCTATVTDLR